MKRCLVTGASGLLGFNLALFALDKYKIIGSCEKEVTAEPPFEMEYADFINKDSVKQLIDQSKPEAIIHCAALANVDQCEKDPALAYRLNTEVPGEIALLTKKFGLKLISISTDSVFDGKVGNYSESDTPNPLNVYARSKLDGEKNVIANDPDAIIARVNFFGWSPSGKRSLAEWFYNNLSKSQKISGFTDVFFNPLEVINLSKLLLKLLENDLAGVYHVASPDTISKYEFGRQIAHLFGFDESLISPTSWQSAGLAADRASNSTLSINKLINDTRVTPPTVRESLSDWHDLYLNKYPQKLISYM